MLRRRFLQGLPLACVPAPAAERTPVILDHDGGMPDDYLSAVLLLTMARVDVLGIVVTPADCYIEPAVSATRKVLDLMGRSEVPVAASTVAGVNPFPAEWRKTAHIMDELPMLNRRKPRARLLKSDGTSFLIDVLRKAQQPVTLLVTGPLSTVADALVHQPGISKNIREIVWMGGALNVPGNVDPKMEPHHDGSAEWNAYWDPPAVARVWSTTIRIIMCPLDITNRVPVTEKFIGQLRAQSRHTLSRLAAESYGKVMASGELFFWDILTTSYLGIPEIFKLREWETEIVTEGRSAARTKARPGGRRIRSLDQVDIERFYNYLLLQWAR